MDTMNLITAIVTGCISLLKEIGGFLNDPGIGGAIGFTWIMGPIITAAGVQRIKRIIMKLRKTDVPDVWVELIAIVAGWYICLLLMVGLWHVPWRTALIHTALITWIYMVTIRIWFMYLKKYAPCAYDAFRTNRRKSPGRRLTDTHPNLTTKDTIPNPDPNDETYDRL